MNFFTSLFDLNIADLLGLGAIFFGMIEWVSHLRGALKQIPLINKDIHDLQREVGRMQHTITNLQTLINAKILR